MKAVILFLVAFPCIQGYKTFKTKEDAEMACRQQTHLVLNPEFSCCNYQVVKNGLIDENAWGKCFKARSSAGTVQEAAWEVYKCVIQEVHTDSSITLSKFAELVSASYEEDIKSKILEKAGTLSDSADFSDLAALDKLRILYYGIEREICEGSSVPLVVSKCSRGEESLHRGGECCGETAFPFPVTYDSWMGKDISHYEMNCRTTINTVVHNMQSSQIKNDVPETMLANLGEMCDSMCLMVNYEPSDRVWNVWSWQFIMDIVSSGLGGMLPPWIPENIVADAVNFAKQNVDINGTIEEIDMYEFSDAVPGNASYDPQSHFTVHAKNVTNKEGKLVGRDFAPRRFPNNLMHIASHCTIVKKLLAYAEVYLTKADNCMAAPADTTVDNPPAAQASETDETTTEPSNDSSDSGTSETESTAGESAESNISGESGTVSSTSETFPTTSSTEQTST